MRKTTHEGRPGTSARREVGRPRTEGVAGVRLIWLTRPALLLRVEGATLLATGVLLCWLYGESPVRENVLLFIPFLLAPDLSMLGYLAGPRIGSIVYNAFHSYPLPAALGVFGLLGGSPLSVAASLVWFAHIGLDRMLGYGLKYPTGFKNQHLGEV